MATSSPAQNSVFSSLHRRSKTAESAAKEKREAAVREAKQYIHEVVRNDWAFDPPATLWSSSTTSPPSSIVSAPATVATTMTTSSTAATATTITTSSEGEGPRSQSLTEVPTSDVIEWRMREYASSASEFDTDAATKGSERHAEKNPYRFESPDAIQEAFVERRRKRREVLEEEAQWNPGLRFFLERRDAWTGAKKRRVVDSVKRSTRGETTAQTIAQQQQHGTKVGGVVNGERTSRVTKDHHAADDVQPSPPESVTEALNDMDLANKDTQEQDSKPPGHPRHSSSDCYGSDDSLIPIMGPFIPNTNSIRSSITPAIYASIYSKVILQGLTPTIPINLSDVTKAMVAGWKADGQWPPKVTVPPPGSDVPVRKKGRPVAKDIGRRGSLGGHGNGMANAVKKVLGLSGHSFHLRRLSRSSANGETAVGPSTGTAGMAVEVPVVEETGK